MFAKVLVALRRPKDIVPISKFLRATNERPFLIVVSFRPTIFVKDVNVTLVESTGESGRLRGELDDFQFEAELLEYDAGQLPATLISNFARDRGCDAILVVSGGDTGMFAADLASTLALESEIPVIVIRN